MWIHQNHRTPRPGLFQPNVPWILLNFREVWSRARYKYNQCWRQWRPISKSRKGTMRAHTWMTWPSVFLSMRGCSSSWRRRCRFRMSINICQPQPKTFHKSKRSRLRKSLAKLTSWLARRMWIIRLTSKSRLSLITLSGKNTERDSLALLWVHRH